MDARPMELEARQRRHGPLTLDLERRQAILFGRTVLLTRLEFELLRALVEAPGRVFTRDELLGRLHALDGKTPTDRALDVLLVRLRRKLRDSSRRPRLIEAVWGVGYRLIAPPADAGVELLRQAIEALAAPALLVGADRTVLAVNAPARRLLRPVSDGTSCFSLLECRTGRCALRDDCPGLRALAARAPVTRGYTITTAAAPASVRAAYLPVAGQASAFCLVLLPTAERSWPRVQPEGPP